MKEEPDDPFNYYAMATELVDNEPEKAKEYFDLLLTRHTDYLPTYYHAAQLYADLDECEKAGEIYKKGIALATTQQNHKTLRELNTAYQNMLYQ